MPAHDTELRPLRHTEIGERLRKDILEGAFAPGARLRIAQLAERYGTSHMPIREALRQLAGESLIELLPNRGARVRAVDAAFITNLFDVRITIESLQARLAAAHRSQEDLRAIRDCRKEFEHYAARQEVPALLQANRRFHQVIGKASRNREAGEIGDRHWRLLPAIWSSHGYPTERLPIVIDDHRLLERLIHDGDADGAATMAAAHALRAKLHMIEAVFSEPSIENL